MTVNEIIAGFPAVSLTRPEPERFEAVSIDGGYACDMLSLVMTGVKPGEAWFTILNSMNVVAVAVLADCPLVILTEGVSMEQPVIERAVAQKVIVLSTQLTTYQACVRLNELLKENIKDSGSV